jgi:hypothetical protein
VIRRVLVGAVVAMVLLPSAATADYADTRFDPDDVSAPTDLRASTRRVLTSDSGRRVLKIVLFSYEDWPRYPDYGRAYVKLDARGGPAADTRLVIQLGNDLGCYIDGRAEVPDIVVEGRRAACKYPMRWIGATKQIRWKVRTVYRNDTHPDYAPRGRGWYA